MGPRPRCLVGGLHSRLLHEGRKARGWTLNMRKEAEVWTSGSELGGLPGLLSPREES